LKFDSLPKQTVEAIVVSKRISSRNLADFGGELFLQENLLLQFGGRGGVGEQEFQIMSVEQNGGMVRV
jgi:hypothetical protein